MAPRCCVKCANQKEESEFQNEHGKVLKTCKKCLVRVPACIPSVAICRQAHSYICRTVGTSVVVTEQLQSGHNNSPIKRSASSQKATRRQNSSEKEVPDVVRSEKVEDVTHSGEDAEKLLEAME